MYDSIIAACQITARHSKRESSRLVMVDSESFTSALVNSTATCLKGLRMIDIESKISAVNCTDI